MDQQEQHRRPDYKRIYTDLISSKFPDKKKECEKYLNKENLSNLNIIELNQKIFGKSDKKIISESQKYRAYDKTTIFEILDYQNKKQCSNSELAAHYNISRNTITKWKKIFSL